MFSGSKSETSKIKGRKPLWLAIVVVIFWMSISSFTGPLFGKLSTVQENNNSSFLPEDSVAFGVLLDTMIVRSILVPALVHEIGPKVWWPSKLQFTSK